jgi:hypothetical protein
MHPRHLESIGWYFSGRSLLGVVVWLFLHVRIFAQEISEPSFELDVLTLLTKHGCNSGACHGAVAGRGEFYLSLWGSNPKADYDQIVHAYKSRRVRFASPEESLLIAKPSGRIAHEGQERFEPDSATAETLIRWIAAGAPFGPSLRVEDFQVSAELIEPSSDRSGYRLRASALLNGSKIPLDVSDRTTWETEPDGDSMGWIQQSPPTLRLRRPGRHWITARFAGQVRSLVLIEPYPDPGPVLAGGASGSVPLAGTLDPMSWIDQEIQEGLDRANLKPLGIADDLTWLRRVSLDFVGRIPSLGEIAEFQGLDPQTRKTQTVDRLIRSEAFGTYWAYKLARWVGFRPIASEPEATYAFEQYLRRSAGERRSWKQIAQELVLSTGDSHREGAANFARLAPDPRVHAERIGSVFLGIRIGCANCHNHPLDRWTQDDYHGLAAILAGIDRGREVRYSGGGQVTNLRTREAAIPKLPGQEFLSVQSEAKAAQANVERLSAWIFDERDPRFATMLANRLWGTMMGRGLVDPVDDLRETNPASHPRLLGRLAESLIEADYQPSSILKLIALSQAYARVEADTSVSRLDPSFYAAREPKAMAPEVLYDAIHDALGLSVESRAIGWLDPTTPSESLDVLGRCGRMVGCSPESELGGAIHRSLGQQLHWINGPLVNRAIESPASFIRQESGSGAADAEILEMGYLRFFGQPGTQEELRDWGSQIPQQTDEKLAWFEDWAWSMLSSPRFLNH